MNNISATVVILTRNSEKTLERALDSVRDFSEVLICDGGSTDATIQIAKKRGLRVTSQDPSCLNEHGEIRDFAGVRNAALREARYKWVLSIDSDETASKELVEEVRSVLAKDPAQCVFRMPAGIILDGVPITRSSNYPGYQIRFFHKDAGIYKKPIHERFSPHGNMPVRTLRAPWHYYIESATYIAEYSRDLPHHLAVYTERYKGKPLTLKLRGIYRTFRSMAGVLLRGTYNNLFFRSKHTYPFKFEWFRVRYQWEVIKTVLRV